MGPGTANFSVNLLEAGQRAFGRLAVVEDRSMGEVARQEHRQISLHLQALEENDPHQPKESA